MSEEKIAEHIDEFNVESYYSGVIMAFSEVVAAGCKKLALSNPLSGDMAQAMYKIAEIAAEEYGVEILLEPDLIVTRLFPGDVAKDKSVILIAQSQGVVDEYLALKQLKENSNATGNPHDIEEMIAKRFGHLLSYSDTKIEKLLKANS